MSRKTPTPTGRAGRVVSQVHATGEYSGAQWAKIPFDVETGKLTDRQKLLYLHLAVRAVTGTEVYKGVAVNNGLTRFKIREWARSKDISEKSVRRDLQALDLACLIRVGERSGNAVLVYVQDPKMVPVVSRTRMRETPHLEKLQLAEIILKSCGIDLGLCLLAPHLEPHSKGKKTAKNGSETANQRAVAAALAVLLESRTRKFLEETHRENPLDAPSHGTETTFSDGNAPSAQVNAALAGPLVSSNGPSGPLGARRSPSASEAPTGAPETGPETAGKGEENFVQPEEFSKLAEFLNANIAKARASANVKPRRHERGIRREFPTPGDIGAHMCNTGEFAKEAILIGDQLVVHTTSDNI